MVGQEGETLVPTSNPPGGWMGQGRVPLGAQGPLPSCGSPAQWNPLSPPPLRTRSTQPHSLVITDADNWPHQEPPLCPPPPRRPTRWYGQASRLCLLRALVVDDAEKDVDGSLGGHAVDAISHSPHCPSTYPHTHRPGTQEAHRGGPVDLIDDQAVGLPTST